MDFDRASQPGEGFARVAQACGEQGDAGRTYVALRSALQQLVQQRLGLRAPSSLRVSIAQERHVDRVPGLIDRALQQWHRFSRAALEEVDRAKKLVGNDETAV